MESRDTRMESHLIDDVLALDAGGLTRALTFDEQKGIRAIILSHRHFDHVKDLLPLGIAIRTSGVTVDIYAIQDTADFVMSKLLDGSLFPDFMAFPSVENPVFRMNVVEFNKEFKVLDYTAVAVPVPHMVPAAGFQISSSDTKLFYTGDTGRGVADIWPDISPDVLLTEVTFGNEMEGTADHVGHLTPALLREALDKFEKHHNYIPRVIISHMNPPWEENIRQELKEITKETGVEFQVADADAVFDL
jgi:Cft2 family RNA processing exonuclease